MCVSWPSGREVNNAWNQRSQVRVIRGAAFKFTFSFFKKKNQRDVCVSWFMCFSIMNSQYNQIIIFLLLLRIISAIHARHASFSTLMLKSNPIPPPPISRFSSSREIQFSCVRSSISKAINISGLWFLVYIYFNAFCHLFIYIYLV